MILKKKILAVVPARGKSKGIKLKNLRKIKKKSLVALVGTFIQRCGFFDKSVISTDSKKIAKEGIKYKLNVIKRPNYLSGDKISDTKVLIHAVLNAEKYYNQKFDVVVMLHPTSPLRRVDDIRKSILKLINLNCDSVWTISKTDSKYHPYKQLNLKNEKISYYSKHGDKIIYRQQLNQLYHRNSAAYVIKRNFLIKKKKLLSKNTFGHIISSKQISIDSLEDLKTAKMFF